MNVPDSIEIASDRSNSFRVSDARSIANGQLLLLVGRGVPGEIDQTRAYIAVTAAGANDRFCVCLQGSDAAVEVADVADCKFCVVPLRPLFARIQVFLVAAECT